MRSVTGKPNLIKLVNKNLILQLLEKKGAVSRAELAKLTKISAPTVSTIVNELITEGIVTELGEGDSSGGRKPTLLAFNPSSYQMVGIELKEGKFRAILTNLVGHILLEEQYSWQGEVLQIEELIRLIRKFLAASKGYIKGSLKGIGIAVPGATDNHRGIVIQATELGWKELPLRALLEQAFPVPIVVDNDVNMATLGEHWRGAGQQIDDLVFVSIGKGIGSGLILGGELYRGSTFFSGEIGYMVVSPHTLLDIEDGYGPLEHHYGNGAVDQATRNLPEYERPMVYREATYHLAYALVNMVSLLNPRRVILDSPDWLDQQFDLLKTIMDRYAPAKVELIKSALQGYATLFGAVYSVIKTEQASVVFRNEG